MLMLALDSYSLEDCSYRDLWIFFQQGGNDEVLSMGSLK